MGKRYFRTDVSTIPLAPVYKGKPKDRWVPVKQTNPLGLRDGLKKISSNMKWNLDLSRCEECHREGKAFGKKAAVNY